MASSEEDKLGAPGPTANLQTKASYEAAPNPRIEVRISFDRATHSYSQPQPPKVTLTVTSQAEHPITIYTWRTPLDPKGALISNGFIITDTITGQPVKTTYIMINRGPQFRVRGDHDEQYFLTLLPNTPLELVTGFGRGGGSIKPDPRSVVERGWELDEQGNERKIRRSTQATGVDGLEPGHSYTIGLDMEALRGAWWAPVTKDEILVDYRGQGSYVQDYPWNRQTSLDFRVSEASLQVQE